MAVGVRRVRAIHRRLLKRYGDLQPPRASDPLDELILTVLSQHTSDANAERAFDALRAAYAMWDDVVRARTPAVADVIRSGGLANTKAPRIQAILREVHDRESGFNLTRLRTLSDDEVRSYLSSLRGVGPKTTAVVMAFALGRDTIPVDTHVHRVSSRLGLIPARTSAEKAHRVLDELVPDELKIPLHVGLIRLGREICAAGRPLCVTCPLKELCPTAPMFLSAGRAPRR
jgi:endonuclease-3